MDLKGIGWKGVECIYMGQDTDELLALEKAMISFSVPLCERNSSTS